MPGASVCRYAFFCVVLCGALSAAGLEPSEGYEGKSIADIRFEPALQPVARPDLARLVTLKPGEPFRLDALRDTLKRLYATGRYSAIEADAEPAGGGLSLVFRTTEQWFVGPVDVRGKVKQPPNEGQLANASRLQLGQPYEDEDLQSAIRGINDLLQRNGFFRSEIQPKIERDGEHQQVSVTFDVDTGKRGRLMLPIIIGDTRIPPEELAKTAKYKGWWFLRWRLATEENTQAGIVRIREKYQSKDRLTADVALRNLDYIASDNRVRPTIEANGGPVVDIQAEGAKVKKKTLKKYVPVFAVQRAYRDLLVRGAGNLRDYFQNQGYFEAQVDFRMEDVDSDHQKITYVVSQGARHKLVDIQIRGNKYFRTDEIRQRMYVQPAGTLRLRHGRYSAGLAELDEDSIKSLYQANGFRDVRVETSLSNDYKGKKGDVAFLVNIVEGPQYRVASINLDGVSLNKEALISELASIPGQPYSTANVALDRDYILNRYFSAGYPDVSFDWDMDEGPGENQVTLRYHISEGQPRYVRDVLITGMRNTSMRLVNPNILLKAGDPLSWTRMGDMQRRLYNLGVFDKVDMAIQNPNGDTQNKYVLYNLSEGHRYYMAFGAGAEVARIGGSQTSLDAPSGATGFAPRGSFEVSRMNMFGLGHSLNFKSRYSTLNRRASLNYLAPRYRNVEGRNISFTALYDNTRDVLTFTARRLEGSAQLSQRFSRATTALWRYTLRDVRVDTSTLKINPLLIPLVSQPARIGILSGNIIQDRRDDPTDAHRGVYNSLDLGLANRGFGGNKNFLRVLFRNSYYKTFAAHYVIASNTSLGWIKPYRVTADVRPFDYVPIAEHFFGGGSTSHRGFPENQAGPRDPLTGFPLGGNALLFHSTELRFPLIGDNIDGVLFHDMGNVYSGLSSISFRVHQKDLTDFDYMVHAAGFGVRYRTPVGPVRVDLSYSVNPPRFNGLKGTYQDLILNRATPTVTSVPHFQFFISIGQAF